MADVLDQLLEHFEEAAVQLFGPNISRRNVYLLEILTERLQERSELLALPVKEMTDDLSNVRALATQEERADGAVSTGNLPDRSPVDVPTSASNMHEAPAGAARSAGHAEQMADTDARCIGQTAGPGFQLRMDCVNCRRRTAPRPAGMYWSIEPSAEFPCPARIGPND